VPAGLPIEDKEDLEMLAALGLVETASRGEADAPNVVVQGKLIVRESTGATYAGQVLANLECE
jgi:hypothetical protein